MDAPPHAADPVPHHEDGPVPDEIPQWNMGQHTHHRDYYTPELRDRVGNLFARDIQVFGYDF
jgi:hypothetical protein